jgi:hypothetical protein
MAVQILLRRGLAADWTSANPTLGAGELGFETDTKKFKIGDGTTAWNSITAYVAGPESLRLQDLLDVAGTAPSTGQVLKWNGTAWAPAADATGGGGTGATYAISAETVSGGANLTLTGSDSSTDSVKLAAGSNVTITRTDADTITIASTATSGATTLDGLSDVVITGTPTTGQVIKFDGTNWVNGTDAVGTGGGAAALDELSDVVITGTPTDGQVLKYDSGTSSWVNGQDLSSTIFTRQTVSGSTSSLADAATGPINIVGYKSYTLLKLETSAAAWVRIYVSEAARIADASRLEGVDPTPGSGVIAEVITTGAETVLISPATIGFNNESPVTTNIPVRVTNKSGATASITVTLTAIQLEA